MKRPKPFFVRASELPEPETAPAFLIGVSGGRDSMALLHWLHGSGFENLVVCHLDHGLRKESRDDAKFVKEAARKHKLRFESSRVDVKALARRTGKSLETAAREARFTFFAKMGVKHGCAHVFLAHHADDQVETFLFNLLRGSGTTGMGAMKARASSLSDNLTLIPLRPWLSIWREEIERYVALHEINYREDQSNTDPRYTRNRVRHEAIPFLGEVMGRDVRQALWRASEIFRADDEFISGHVPAPEEAISVAALRELPEALQRRSIHAWLKRHKIKDVGFEEIEAVRSLLGMKTAKVNLPGNRHAFRREKKIRMD